MRFSSALMLILLGCSTGSGKPDAGAALGTGGHASANGGGANGSTGGATSGGDSSIYIAINSDCDVVKADHTSPLIDDMEDGDTYLLPNEGRDGNWWWSKDTTPDAALNFEIVAIPGGRGSSTKAAHVVGSGETDYGAVGGFNLLPSVHVDGGPWISCPYDMSAYTGIQFWARGNNVPVRVKASMAEDYPVSFGGICAAADPNACWNDHGTYQTFVDSWKQFTVPFSGMTQSAGWGITTTFNAAHVTAIRFQTDGNVNFDYWIDDISFY
jgi:hypothetical protein